MPVVGASAVPAAQGASAPLRVDLAQFARDFPTTPTSALAKRYGVSPTTIARRARELGLRKGREYRAQLLREKRVAGKMQPARGPAHYNWKGGRTWERFRDPRYLDWRKAVLERDGYKCQQCGRRCKKYERGLAAHHVRSWADAPELRFNLTNGVTLCRECHMALHGLGPKEVPLIPCACGCGSLIRAEDPYGRPRRFVNHHHSRGRTVSAATRQQLSRNRRGRSLTPEHRRNISKGLRTSSKRIGRPPGARSTR